MLETASHPASFEMADHNRLSLWGRTTVTAAMALSVTAFVTIGYLVMEPDNPRGAVSLLACSGPLGRWLQLTILAGVVATMAAAIAGRALPDVGTCAAALGMAALSLLGEDATALLVERAGNSASFQRALAMRMLIEAVGWFLAVSLCLVTSSIAFRWLIGSSGSKSTLDDRDWLTSAEDLPGIGGRFSTGKVTSRTTNTRTGLLHAATAAAIAWAVIALLFSGVSARAITHGDYTRGADGH